MNILIIGGAGFTGSHTADTLLAAGYQVRVFDNLEPQVHGPRRQWPAYLDECVERVLGDVRDRAALAQALPGIDVVFHLAAATGGGQSPSIYVCTEVNTSITELMDLLCDIMLPELRPEVVEITRVGDIRHCTADLELARKCLGYAPRVPLQQGLQSVIEDAKQHERLEDLSVLPGGNCRHQAC